MKRGVVLAGLLMLNAWAGACSYDPAPNKYRRIFWSYLMSERGLPKEFIDVKLSNVEWSNVPHLPEGKPNNFVNCNEVSLQVKRETPFERTICEAVSLRPATVKVLIESSYDGKNTPVPGGYLFRFAGGAGSQIPGTLWNGIQVYVLQKAQRTVLVWQSLKEPTAADALNQYLWEKMGNYSVKHPYYWDIRQRLKNCSDFGIEDTDFAKFSDCFVSPVDESRGLRGDLVFRLTSSSDETLESQTYYRLDWGTTCGSRIEPMDENLVQYLRSKP